MKLSLILLAGALLALTLACGTPGVPLPPSLELPRPAADLAATRKGDFVTLAWSPPRDTTDGTRLGHPGRTRICHAANVVLMNSCVEVVAEIPPASLPASGHATYTWRLPQALQEKDPTGAVTLGVETLNDRGRSAGISNQVIVPLAPTLPPPLEIRARGSPDGVVLTWTGDLHEHDPQNRLRHAYRVFRRPSGTDKVSPIADVMLEKSLAAEFLDRNVEWETRYEYRVTPVTIVGDGPTPPQVEGDDSPFVSVFVHDSFPPATPGGLEAVFSGLAQQRFVDLTWAPNLEPDIAGYNLYRHLEGGQPTRINTELVKTPAFRDANVAAARRYFYAVSAVDLRGNESPQSATASEAVP